MSEELNPEQLAGVKSHKGDTVVIAGPGAGKTRVLVERYKDMLFAGIPSHEILNLTFTSAAAEEMADRVGLMDSKKVFRTFHSFCLDFLKKNRNCLSFQTCDTIIPVYGEQFKLYKKLLDIYPMITSENALVEYINRSQAEDISPDEALELAHQASDSKSPSLDLIMAHAYNDYTNMQRQQGWLDFHGLIVETINVLKEHDDVRERTKRKYIAVDECQDTDVRQFELLNLLYAGNIFVVGDENQLIYEWRSAQSGNLTNFSQNYKGAKTLFLGTNYRSTQKLVEFFRKILPVDNGLASHMVSGRAEVGEDPDFVKYFHEDEEANVILDQIVNRGIGEHSAILARTNRQLQLFQRRAMSRNIKTQILGKKNVWQEWEVKHLIELLKKEASPETEAAASLTRLIKVHGLANLYSRMRNNPMEKSPVDNMNDVVRMAARKNKTTGERLTAKEFLMWLNKITNMRPTKSESILTLSTVHQAKGREWKHVFLIGCNQGLMPHKDGDLNEEKRIFFVGCTRAADELQISFTENRTQFLNDFAEEVVTFGQNENEGEIPWS